MKKKATSINFDLDILKRLDIYAKAIRATRSSALMRFLDINLPREVRK